MAKKFKKMPKIAEAEDSGFGQYQEALGGGSPKGGIWGGSNGRIGWEERKKMGEVKEGEDRQSQPRDKSGHFTYNSVNGKETKYPGRGETVNPLLTGGDGTIKIDDVKSQFTAKSGDLYDKYKDKWYQKGSEKITLQGKKYVTKLSNEDIWEIGRKSWDIKKGELSGESGTFEQSKSGRSTKFEKAAKALTKKTGQEQFVKSDTGAIQVKGEQAEKAYKKLTADATGSKLKHSPAQIAAYRKLMEQKHGKEIVDQFTDEQIDQVIED